MNALKPVLLILLYLVSVPLLLWGQEHYLMLERGSAKISRTTGPEIVKNLGVKVPLLIGERVQTGSDSMAIVFLRNGTEKPVPFRSTGTERNGTENGFRFSSRFSTRSVPVPFQVERNGTERV